MKIDEDQRAGYRFRFAQATPPTWRAKDVDMEARSPMGHWCPVVVQQGESHVAQRAEAAGDNTAVDKSLLPRFGPLCSVKPYSYCGGLNLRKTITRSTLARKGCLGSATTRVQVWGSKGSNPLLGCLGPPFIG